MLHFDPLLPLMPHPFQGNKSFIAFSNLGDTDSLTKTWKVRRPLLPSLSPLHTTTHQVCTKVASFLEQGQRLENLSWRLWHLQNLMVDVDSAKSKREFKRLSKSMSDKLDKEKGRSVISATP
jgi:GATA-binding protein, other eukaryote